MVKQVSLFSKITLLVGVLVLIAGVVAFFSWSTFQVFRERDSVRQAHLSLMNGVQDRLGFSRERNPDYLFRFSTHLDDFEKHIPRDDQSSQAVTLRLLKGQYLQQVSQYGVLMNERGLNEDLGVEGMFREKAHNLEALVKPYNQLYIFLLQARRSEKDFIMRQHPQYITKVDDAIAGLLEESRKQPLGAVSERDVIDKASGYLVAFHEMVKIYQDLHTLESQIASTERQMQDVISTILAGKERRAQWYKRNSIIMAVLFLLSGAVFSLLFARHITRPLVKLKDAAIAVAQGNLDVQVQVQTNDELGDYAKVFNRMLKHLRFTNRQILESRDELNRKNEELEKNYTEMELQRQQLEKAYDNLLLLTRIGKQIISSLHITSIVRAIYDNVSKLFDVSVYAIGMIDERNKRLNFYGTGTEVEDIGFSADYLSDENRLSVWCYKKQREVIINNYDEEYQKYIEQKEDSPHFANGKSVLILPLSLDSKKFGVIIVRSDKPSAFDDYHIYILRNIAMYAAIAFDNAQAYDQISGHKEEILAQNGHLAHLNRELELQKKLIEHEREKSDMLLLNILPQETAHELKEHGKATPRHYESVTVMFADFKDFTRIAEQVSPIDLVNNLDRYFAAFDEIVKRHGLEKIKTIGDAYLCAGGLGPAPVHHALQVILAAQEIQQYMDRTRIELFASGKPAWELRIGVHTGEVVAGVVGRDKFAYDIWGDTVNSANRLQGKCEPGRINISGSTAAAVKDYLQLNYRGKITAKNKGELDMYYVEGIRPGLQSAASASLRQE